MVGLARAPRRRLRTGGRVAPLRYGCPPWATQLTRSLPLSSPCRANLRLVYLAPTPALDCLTLGTMRYRAGVTPLRFDSFNRPSVRLKPYELKTSFLSR